MVRLGLWVWGKQTMEVKSHFYHMMSGVPASTGLITGTGNFDHLVEVVSARFLHCKVTIPLFSYSSLWKQVTKHSSLKGYGAKLHHLEVGESTQIIGNYSV